MANFQQFFIFLSISLIYIGTTLAKVNVTIIGEDGDKLAEFLSEVMPDYPEWVASKNLDPTPNVTTKYDLKSDWWSSHNVKVNLSVWNTFMTGLSNPGLYDRIDVYGKFNPNEVELQRRFYVELYTNGLTYAGNYEVSGNVTDKVDEKVIDFRAAGQWQIKIDQEKQYAGFVNFKVLEDGRLDIEGQDPGVSSVPYTSNDNVDFQGILEGNAELAKYEDDIKTELFRVFTWSLWNANRNPAAKVFKEFAKTFRGFHGFKLA